MIEIYYFCTRVISQAMTKNHYFNLFVEWATFTLAFFFLYDVIWLLADIDDFTQNLQGDYRWLLVDFGYCGLFALTSLLLNHWIIRLDRFHNNKNGWKPLIVNAIMVLLSNLFVAGLLELFLSCFFPNFVSGDIWGNSFLFGLIASMMACVWLTIHYAKLLVKKSNENAALQKKYLKLQLNPHFVFNSLSSLVGMIETDPEMAEQYVIKLAGVFRYMLKHIEKDLITMEEVRYFSTTYVEMLNIRYNNMISLEMGNFFGCRNEFVLALSLQLLIENAVKHNAPVSGQMLHIVINRQDDSLVVSNNRIFRSSRNDQKIESYGMGISNLRKRYVIECGKEPEFKETHDTFSVTLPIIHIDKAS